MLVWRPHARGAVAAPSQRTAHALRGALGQDPLVYANAGLNAIFVTQSNDLALGLPIIQVYVCILVCLFVCLSCAAAVCRTE